MGVLLGKNWIFEKLFNDRSHIREVQARWLDRLMDIVYDAAGIDVQRDGIDADAEVTGVRTPPIIR
jgi:hypothetical protein